VRMGSEQKKLTCDHAQVTISANPASDAYLGGFREEVEPDLFGAPS